MLENRDDLGNNGDHAIGSGKTWAGFIDFGHGWFGLAHGTLRMDAAA
jgi:hypothetical protein